MWFVVVLVWLCYVSVGGWGKGVIVISCRTVALFSPMGAGFFVRRFLDGRIVLFSATALSRYSGCCERAVHTRDAC